MKFLLEVVYDFKSPEHMKATDQKVKECVPRTAEFLGGGVGFAYRDQEWVFEDAMAAYLTAKKLDQTCGNGVLEGYFAEVRLAPETWWEEWVLDHTDAETFRAADLELNDHLNTCEARYNK